MTAEHVRSQLASRIPLALRLALALSAALTTTHGLAAEPGVRPNIIFFMADDLGYGDVKCLNPEGKIATPHLDRLAAEGMRFTDAHSSSVGLHADALRRPDRPLQLALAAEERRAGRVLARG